MSSLEHLYRVALQVPHEHTDAFVEAIEPHCDSVAWTARQGQIRSGVTGFVAVSPIKENINRAISLTAAAKGILAPKIQISRIPIKNWVLENFKQFPPVRIGRYFIYDRNFTGKIPTSTIPLKVPFGAAFGTGRHGSTQGCLMALDSLKKRSLKSALDMGCGSGILALAISKRWRCQVVASDIDTTASRTAKANSVINGEKRFVSVLQGPGYCARFFLRRQFDLIVSNIVAQPLVKMSSNLSRCLAFGGTAILSGFLASQEAQILTAHRLHGLKLRRRIRIDGWSTLVLCKDA